MLNITLTNDDGYDAPGLIALHQAVSALPDVSITVIAPSVVQSGVSHAVSDEITYERVSIDTMGEVIKVDGTPADCARLAAAGCVGPRPDWLLSGINRGGNMGYDIYYSGTVAAAREATLHGIPAIALSQLIRSDIPEDWPRTTRWAAALVSIICRPDTQPPALADPDVVPSALQAIKQNPLAYKVVPFWSINFPRPPAGHKSPRVCVVLPGPNPPALDACEEALPDSATRLTYTTPYTERGTTPGTDCHTVFNHDIALSPLHRTSR